MQEPSLGWGDTIKPSSGAEAGGASSPDLGWDGMMPHDLGGPPSAEDEDSPEVDVDLGWGASEDLQAQPLGYANRSGRARSHSFYEDDDDVGADLDAAITGVPRARGPDGGGREGGGGAGGGGSSSRGRSDSMDGEGSAPRGPRVGALNPNEMAALRDGLHSHHAAVVRRGRADSSDVEDDGESGDDGGSAASDDFDDGSATDDGGASASGGRSAGGGGRGGHLGADDDLVSDEEQVSRSLPPVPGSASLRMLGYASNPGSVGRPGLGEYRDGFPGAALDDAALQRRSGGGSGMPPTPPGMVPARLNIPRAGGGVGGVGGSYVGYGHVRRTSPSNARKIKILMLGDTGVGKSSLINRFTEDTFNPSLVGTVGVDFKMKPVQIDGEDVLLQVWDTAGQERFHKITRAYYRGSHGIVIVYDLSNPATLENIEYWMRNIQDNAGQTVKTCLVGNKMDLRDELEAAEEAVGGGGGGGGTGTCHGGGGGGRRGSRGGSGSGDFGYDMVGTDDGRRIADKFGIQFFEASAKTGVGVMEAYMSVARAANADLRLAAKPATPVKGGSRKISLGRGRSKARVAAKGAAATGGAAAGTAGAGGATAGSRERGGRGDAASAYHSDASDTFASGSSVGSTAAAAAATALAISDAAAAAAARSPVRKSASSPGRSAQASSAAGAGGDDGAGASKATKRKDGAGGKKNNNCKVS